MEIAKLYATVDADVRGVTTGLATVDTKLSDTAKKAETAADSIKKSFRDLGSQLQTIGVGMTAAFSVPAGLAAKVGLSFNAMKEQAQVAFTTMLGSADKAREHLEQLRQFSDKTPFEFLDVVAASKRFQAFGLAAKDVLPTLTAIGDAAAATGLGKEAIDRLTLSLGQMIARGKITGEEFRELGASGVPALKILSEALGKSADETRKMVEKGLIPANFALKALVNGIETSNLGGMMEKQSQTFLGVLSTLKDTIESTLGDAFQPLFTFIADGLRQMVPLVQQFGEWWKALPDPIKNTVLAMGGVVAIVGPITAAVGAIVAAVAAVGAPVAAAVFGITALVSEQVAVLTLLWTTNFAGFRDGAKEAFQAVAAFAQQYGGQLVAWWEQNLPLIRETARKVWGGIQSIIQTVMQVIGPFVRSSWQAIVSVIVNGTKVILGVMRSIMQAINGDWRGAWETIVSTAANALDRLIQTILLRVSPATYAAYKIGSAIAKGILGPVGEASTIPIAPAQRGSLRLGGSSLRLGDVSGAGVPKLNLGGGGGGGGKGSKTDAAADLLARLKEETAKLGLTTKAQEIAVDLLGEAYRKANPAVKEAILAAAKEYDAKKATLEVQKLVVDLIKEQGEVLRELVAIPPAELPFEAANLELSKQIQESWARQSEAVKAYESAVDSLNAKLIRKQNLSELERIQIELTTGALQGLDEVQRRQVESLAIAIDAQTAAAKKLDALQNASEKIANVFKGAFQGLFENGFQGFADRLKSGFAQLLSELAAQLIQSALFKLLNKFFGLNLGGAGGAAGGAGGGFDFGGLFGSIIGSLFGGLFGGFFGGGGGGGAAPSLFSPFGPGLAEGGPVMSNKSYIVGERGPEVFVPNTSGMIVPNNLAFGGAGGPVVNQTLNFYVKSDNGYIARESQGQIAARSGQAARRALERNE